jgi:hypothetical protein
VSWVGCGPSQGDYFQRVRELSGPDAVDCGHVPVQHELRDALSCMETEVAANRPFRVSVETYGLESILTFAVVRTPQGELLTALYDPDACGGNCWLRRPFVRVGRCPSPQVVRGPSGGFDRDPIRCEPPGS